MKANLYFYNDNKTPFKWLKKVGIYGRGSHIFSYVVEVEIIHIKLVYLIKIMYNGQSLLGNSPTDIIFGTRRRS